MTKQQAIAAMIRGQKVTHQYFTPDEFITMESGSIVDEKGYRFTPFSFWSYRKGEEFNDNWQVFKPV